jgi:hypothetical protein
MEIKLSSLRVTLNKWIYVFSQNSQRDVPIEELLESVFFKENVQQNFPSLCLSNCEEMDLFIHCMGNGVSLYNLESFV